ncbi:MAG TPA: tetratricopeptide repeat protein [Woeseiaceae bacterium]|nr:tetratricopeptide repeat protein [Woeseiaceae bacterium]
MDSASYTKLQRAAQDFESGRLPEAEAACRDLLRLHPDAFDVLHLLALVRRKLGDVAEAEALLRRCLVLAPASAAARANLGNLLADAGRLPEARQAYEQALALDSGFRQARLGLARLLNRVAEHGAAESEARWLVDRDANDAEAWSALAAACRGLGEPARAASAYRQALRIRPHYGVARHNLAALLAEGGRSEEALAAVDAAAACGIDGPGIDFTRAGILMSLYRFDEAEQVLVTSIAGAPRVLATQRLLARLRFMQGADAFERDFSSAVERFPDDRGLRIGYAQLLRGAGRPGEAAAALERGLQRDGTDPRLLAEQAAVRQESGDFAGALRSAETAIRLAPGNPGLEEMRVDALVALGRAAEALPAIERLRRRNPANQWYIALEATAARLLGDPRYRRLYDYDRFVRCYELAAPAGWPGIGAFQQELARVLRDRHRFRAQPLDQSIRSGTQTPRSLLGDPAPVIRAFLEALTGPLEEYRCAIGAAADHPFTARNTGPARLSGCWSVLLQRGGHHVNHVHPEGWISSAYYVEVPAGAADEQARAGWLKLGEPRFAVPGAPAERYVQPVPGRLVLFPSYMWHGTTPLTSGEGRLAVAFDAVPESRLPA